MSIDRAPEESDAALLALTRQRWMVPLLAAFAGRSGARTAELLRATGAPRDTLARTLAAAQAAGWIARNPGHGHPLRPEYLVTQAGAAMVERAGRIRDAMAVLGLADASLSRWSLPILNAMAAGHARFADIARALPGVTPRALTAGLKDLTGKALVTRTLVEGWPPSTRYALTARGVVLASA